MNTDILIYCLLRHNFNIIPFKNESYTGYIDNMAILILVLLFQQYHNNNSLLCTSIHIKGIYTCSDGTFSFISNAYK